MFLTNFLPPARQSLRIDVDDIRAVNPDIIYVRGSGQGQRGPEADKGGYDGCVVLGPGGRPTSSATRGEYPIGQPGPAFGDMLGGMTIAGGICAALFHRERTGEALVVDNSLLATAMWATGATHPGGRAVRHLRGAARRPDARCPTRSSTPTGPSDGRFLSLMMLQSDRYWPELVTKIGHPELADDPRFVDAAAR